jgi:signal-transduction protein with cAMP-binding, CBS, and nucleotidyltransferase domain
MKIEQCTLLKPLTCKATGLIGPAAKKLKENKLRHLYVVNKENEIQGIFAGSDVVYNVIAEGVDYRKMKVEEVMNKDIVSFSVDDPLIKAVGFMSHSNIQSCPILKEGKLIGVLSYKEAMHKAVAEQKRMKEEK